MILFSPVKAAAKYGQSRFEVVAAALVGVGVSVFVFAMYLGTLAPTVLYYDRPILLDSALLQVQAIVLGIPGPTGEPGWVLLTHLFTYLPFGDLAYRTNLASAVYAGLTVGLVFVAGLLLSRRVAAAAAGALAFGVGGIFWSQAVIAEVYTLNALLIMLPIVTLLLWRNRRQDRYLLLSAFLTGLALTNHLTSGLVIPIGVLFVAMVDRWKLLEAGLVLKGVGLFQLGLTPYLYLPIRASMDPPMNEADPSTFGRFWYLVSGGDHHQNSFAYGPVEIPGRLALYADYLLGDFHWVLVAVAVLGATYLLLRDRAGAALIVLPYVIWVFHAVEYRIFDVQIYFIPSFLMLAVAMAVGFGVVLKTVEAQIKDFPRLPRRPLLAVLSVLLAAAPLVGVGQTYAENDMSEDYRGREIIENVAQNALPNSTILHHRSALWYLLLVEERRQDLTIIDPWYPSWTRTTDIVWPDDIGLITTNLRYGTNDYTGVSTAWEAARRGPVYILDQESAGPHNFYDAGFNTIRVEGILFELVPPGQDPYTRD